MNMITFVDTSARPSSNPDLTDSPAEITPGAHENDDETSPADADPIVHFQHEDCDTVDREIASYFSSADASPPVPRNAAFEENWHRMNWINQKSEIGRLFDGLETTQWKQSAECLFYVSLGAWNAHTERDTWLIGLKRVHGVLANAGLLTCLTPLMQGAVTTWESSPDTPEYEAEASLLLAIFYVHIVCCFHFQIHVALSEPCYVSMFTGVVSRLDLQQTSASMQKKFGGAVRIRDIKDQLIRYYDLEQKEPEGSRMATKASEHDYSAIFSEFLQRYPALILPKPDPTAMGRAIPPRRAFSSRKKIASQEQLLLPVDDDTEGPSLPPPLKECIDTYLVHRSPNLYAHLLRAADKEDFPPELEPHFEQLKQTYAQVLPHMHQWLLNMMKMMLFSLPSILHYPAENPNQGGVTGGVNGIGGDFSGDGPPNSISPTSHRVPRSVQLVRRDREIISCATVSALLLALRHWTLSHPLQGEHVGQLLMDGNILVLILRVLSIESLPSYLATPQPVDAAEPPFLMPFLRPPPGYTFRNALATANLLKLARCLTRNRAHRVLFLYNNKCFNVMKRLVAVNNYYIMRGALKLLKAQMPFVSRKWRQANIAIISLIYHHLSPKLVDDYLMTSDPETEGAEGVRHEEHLRALTRRFHQDRFPEIASDDESCSDDIDPALGGSVAAAAADWAAAGDLSFGDLDDDDQEDAWMMEVDGDGQIDEVEGTGADRSLVLHEWRDEYEEKLAINEWWTK